MGSAARVVLAALCAALAFSAFVLARPTVDAALRGNRILLVLPQESAYASMIGDLKGKGRSERGGREEGERRGRRGREGSEERRGREEGEEGAKREEGGREKERANTREREHEMARTRRSKGLREESKSAKVAERDGEKQRETQR